MDKIQEIDEAIDDTFAPMNIDSSAQSIEDGLADMHQSMSASAQAMLRAMKEEEEKQDPWFQSVTKYLLAMKEVKEALKRTRMEGGALIMEKTRSFTSALPEGMKTKLHSFSENLLARADSLPDVIKSRLPLEAVKRLT